MLAALPLGAQEQGPLPTRKRGQKLPWVMTAAVRTPQAPVLDGKLDDAAWDEAAVADEFVLYGKASPATQQSDARVLWDDSHLYIGMRCFDADLGKLKKTIARRDGPVFGDDCIEVFFIPPDNPLLAKAPARERYFHLSVNALGARYDEIGYEAPARWNGKWTVKTSERGDRWELEIAIPWTDLKSQPEDGTVWDINFNRGLPARGPVREYSGWSLTFAGFHDPAHFGKLIFLDRWPEPGSRTISTAISLRVLRGTELDPLLSRTGELLKDAGAKLRAVSAKAKIARIAETLAAVDALGADLAGQRRSLEAMTPAQALAGWETLRTRHQELQRKAELLAAKAGFCSGLTPGQLSGAEPIPDFVTFALPAMTNERVLPRRLPTNALPEKILRLTACPGEYESGSFGLYALANLDSVRLTATELRAPAGVVPPSALDLRVVKVWYQAGRGIGFQNVKLLAPELLLKDDSLVRIDERRQTNILKLDKDAMRDADALQPFPIEEGTVKQCWVTVQVPAGAKPGTYRGAVRIATGKSTEDLPVELRVLPFELLEPKIICSIYYRARLGATTPKCTSEGKTEEQLLAEFRDMRAHGVTNPTVYQGLGPDLQRYFDIRRQAGMHGGPLLILGVGVHATPEELQATVEVARANGFTDTYFYAADERSGDELRAERPLFRKVHDAGGKVFVACYQDSYEIVGDLLDLPIFSGKPDVEIGRAFHANGALIGSYGNPQGGVEEPETYRRNFGLALWKAGYDCACTYAYQHSFTHAWDDFDNATYRDHNMAYPTVNGVIPTIQWEGYREGYDDLRYLATLEDLVERAKRLDGPAGEAARTAQLWIERIDPEATPLDDIRAGMIERILAIRGASENK